MLPTQPLPPKKEVALALLERSSVYVHLDPRQAAVVVPPWFKKQPQLVLQVGLNMPVPIPDLRVDDEGLSCTLSFNRAPHYCVVPWSSVFAMVGEDGRGMVWPDDVPAEVARQAQGRAGDGTVPRESAKAAAAPRAPKGDAPRAKRSRKRPALAAVPADAAREASGSPAKAARADSTSTRPVVAAASPSRPAVGNGRKKKELPPYLRVVK
jgi:stringent starvation protein B